MSFGGHDDPITAEEITGQAVPEVAAKGVTERKQPKRLNACMLLPFNCNRSFLSSPVAELMATKKAKNLPPHPPPAETKHPSTWDPRDGLGTYITHPEAQQPERVIQYDDEFVVINDMYPKASVHLLLLPRDPQLAQTHPLKALSDPNFLTTVAKRVQELKHVVASELRRKYGRSSASDRPYQEVLEAAMTSEDPPPPEERDKFLPPGRDWEKDVIAGVHTHPSMNHLHVHVFSRDMHSPCLKHKKHYLSFNTDFLVQLHEFPLDADSERFSAGDWPSKDMICWRCGKNFGNKFKALKAHLATEFEDWKQE